MRTLGAILLGALALSVAAPPASAGWSGPASVPGPTGLSVPHVAMDRAGEAAILWGDVAGRLTAVLRSATGPFSTPQRLATAGQSALEGEQLAMGPDGTAIAVWAQFSRRSPHYRIMGAVRPPRGRFGAARMIGRAQSIWRSTPSAAVARDGTIAVGWSRGDAPQIAVRRPGHGFGAPRSLPGPGSQLVVAFDARGRLCVAFARRTGIAVAFADRALRPGRARGIARGVDPALAPTGDGSLVLVWRDGAPDSSERIGRGAIWAAVAPDRRAFGAPARISPAGIVGRQPVVVGGPRAATLVSWDLFGGGWPTYPPGTGPVFTWLSQRGGDGGWIAPQSLAPPGDWTTVPASAGDASGTATVAYARRGDGGARTLIVRSGPAGAPLGDELALATTTDPLAADAHNVWSQAAAAASGTTTLVVWPAGIGRGLVAYVRTPGP